MPLDRILKIKINEKNTFIENSFFEPSLYFKDIIGVTRFDKPVEHVVFWVSKENALYVFTKPFHSSQKFIEHTENGSLFFIQVIPNFELERELLGFGEHLKVISPEYLKNKIACRISAMALFYK